MIMNMSYEDEIWAREHRIGVIKEKMESLSSGYDNLIKNGGCAKFIIYLNGRNTMYSFMLPSKTVEKFVNLLTEEYKAMIKYAEEDADLIKRRRMLEHEISDKR